MRRLIAGLVVALGMSAGAAPGLAQALPNDPFFLYYGYYVPRQQTLAAQVQGGSQGIITSNTASRQFAAEQARAGLYEAPQPFGLADLDPNAGVGAGRNAAQRRSTPVQITPFDPAAVGQHSPIHYNRTSFYYRNQGVGRRGGGGAASRVVAPGVSTQPRAFTGIPQPQGQDIRGQINRGRR